MNEYARNNKYFENAKAFQTAIDSFFFQIQFQK